MLFLAAVLRAAFLAAVFFTAFFTAFFFADAFFAVFLTGMDSSLFQYSNGQLAFTGTLAVAPPPLLSET